MIKRNSMHGLNMQVKLGLLAGAAFFAMVANAPAQAGFQWTAPTDSAGIRAPQTPAAPRVQAAPVAPVISEDLPSSLSDIGVPAAPSYVPGSSDDPVMWNTPAAQQNTQNARGGEVYIPRNQGAARTQQPAAPVSAPQSVLPAQQQAQQPQTIYQPEQARAPQAPAATPFYTEPMTTPAAPVQQATAPLNQGGSFDVAEGFGSDLPLVMAIRQIAPASYGFVFDEGIDLATQVSWQGGQPWNVVLQNVLTPLQLRAQIAGNVISILPAHKAGATQNVAVEAGVFVTSEAVITNGQGSVSASAPVMPTPMYQQAVVVEEFVAGPVLASATRPDLHAKTVWTAPRNSTLRSILEDWSNRVGVELYWASEYDYPVQSGVTINGSFEEAVQVLLRGLSESRPRPLGRLHPNLPDGPAVLLIETREVGL